MSVITKSVKSILQELDLMKQMKNVKIAQFSFLPKENNLIKESKCYKLSVNVQLLLISFKQSTFEYPVLC